MGKSKGKKIGCLVCEIYVRGRVCHRNIFSTLQRTRNDGRRRDIAGMKRCAWTSSVDVNIIPTNVVQYTRNCIILSPCCILWYDQCITLRGKNLSSDVMELLSKICFNADFIKNIWISMVKGIQYNLHAKNQQTQSLMGWANSTELSKTCKTCLTLNV